MRRKNSSPWMLTIRRTVEYYIRNVRGKAYACFLISIDEASVVETPPVGKSSISIGVSHHDTSLFIRNFERKW